MEPVDDEVPAAASDAQLVTRVIEGHRPAFTVLMRRHNPRLFRIARAIVGGDAEAEDVCQEAWLLAYANLVDLNDGSAFAAWLGCIGRRRAFARLQQVRGIVSFDDLDRMHADGARTSETVDAAPDDRLESMRLVRRIERAIDGMTPSYRAVVLLRDVEDMTTTEAAEVLGLTEENVRVRLHRARADLRARLQCELGDELHDAFRFDGDRCERIGAAVLTKLAVDPAQSERRYSTRSA